MACGSSEDPWALPLIPAPESYRALYYLSSLKQFSKVIFKFSSPFATLLTHLPQLSTIFDKNEGDFPEELS
jgi:hypothetical protein